MKCQVGKLNVATIFLFFFIELCEQNAMELSQLV